MKIFISVWGEHDDDDDDDDDNNDDAADVDGGVAEVLCKKW